MEHISHHPPVSCFQVDDFEKKFAVQGSFEYQGRITDSGNSVTGRLVGKNKVTFGDERVEYEYPSFKISGLIYGKRTTQWIGAFEFADRKNGLQAKIEFSSEKSFFSRYRSNLPLDCFQGTITKNGASFCKIEGSWLEFLRFDDLLYWELETCDTVRPVSVDHWSLLDSDCRYREDMIIFELGDEESAQK